MTTIRRRVLRPVRNGSVRDGAQHARIERRRAQLEKDRKTVARWMIRLKRSFHAVEKQQRRIARLEKQLANLDPA